ncbi:Aste57867_12250 [Aphanomyces stellatus]|uniref:Aste57867_12250 protein n=1 Tax=Aphanomyces stellatus TaxID=120398 RepID=A0A485KVP6_9STRA|nr:hypothetical protein As57867_012205 [Aphanomyces stellatus]VFT89103.1 Aste57867_12250 [Aphanomyces stellatus]
MEFLADISDLLVDPLPVPVVQDEPAPVLVNAIDNLINEADDEPAADILDLPTEEAVEEAEEDPRLAYEPEISQWSSTDDDEEKEEETSTHLKTRKKRKIADILDDDDLEEDTLLAREEEKERAKLFKASETTTDFGFTADGQICLNPLSDGGIPTGQIGDVNAPVLVHPAISKVLKPHQVVGVRFLWSHISAGQKGFGCILADYMGLGKTLQVITTVHTFLNAMTLDDDGSEVAKFNSALILAPAICVRNWESEFNKWLPSREVARLRVTALEADKSINERINAVLDWNNNGGVMVMGYEMYRNIVLQATGEEKLSVKSQNLQGRLKDALACLTSPGPDLIVLDEGHRIRDAKSKLVKALNHVETKRRIILTGYPIQNHMKEYWTMVNFARPNYLGTLPEFKNRFIDPIENGQFEDSSPSDIVLSRKRTFILTKELSTLVLRRDAGYLHKQLPAKHEFVLLCKLSPLQVQIYKAFLREGVPKNPQSKKIDVLGGYHISLAIVNHPDVLQQSLPGRETAPLPVAPPIPSDEVDSDVEAVEVVRTMPHRLSFAQALFPPEYPIGVAEHSGKMVLLLHILRECRAVGDRTTVFSQSIPTLTAIENMLSNYNQTKKSYEKIHSVRIDGSTSQQMRFQRIAQFNDPDEEVDVILISTRAGGEGARVNLCGGNRVVIFDVCWNPCHDSQSMCRSYRFGQVKPVCVYRLISAGTMEKKVYDLQVKKEGVSKRVVDNTALERKFQKQDVKKYFDIHDFKKAQTALLKTDTAGDIAMAKPGSDSVLASVLKTRSSFLVEWFEQDSMFEEKPDERCSEQEQQEALEENEVMKAARGINLHQVMRDNPSGMKRIVCEQCNHSNPFDEISVLGNTLLCTACETPMDISDPARIVTVNNANHPEIVQQQQAYEARMREMLAHANNQVPNGVPNGVANGLSNGYSNGALMHRPMPPTFQAFAGNQYQNTVVGTSNYPVVVSLEDDDMQLLMPPLPRPMHTMQLANMSLPVNTNLPPRRRILFLKRGLKRADFEELRTQAENRLGIKFEVELTENTTDLVSGLTLDGVLSWLQLQKLPGKVTLRPVEWLKEQLPVYY